MSFCDFRMLYYNSYSCCLVDGKDAEETISLLSDTEQYVYGLRSGEILRKIHWIPAPESYPKWEERFNKKIDRNIVGYQKCKIKFNGDEHMIHYINANRHLLFGRPQCFQHGDLPFMIHFIAADFYYIS